MDYGALSSGITDFQEILVGCYTMVKENKSNMHESNLKRALVAQIVEKLTDGEKGNNPNMLHWKGEWPW